MYVLYEHKMYVLYEPVLETLQIAIGLLMIIPRLMLSAKHQGKSSRECMSIRKQ